MKNQKSFEIQIPDGFEIDKEKSTFEKFLFKEIGIIYDTISDKLFKNRELHYFIADSGGIQCTKYGGSLCPNNSMTKEQLESILALNKLCNVAKYLNGNWLIDWENIDQHKYIILLRRDKLCVDAHSWINEGNVFFKTKYLAQQAIIILGEDEIRKALTLNH